MTPGRSVDLGDRRITLLRPPSYDSPSTIAVYDEKSEVLFSADSFGTALPEMVDDAADVDESAYLSGCCWRPCGRFHRWIRGYRRRTSRWSPCLTAMKRSPLKQPPARRVPGRLDAKTCSRFP